MFRLSYKLYPGIIPYVIHPPRENKFPMDFYVFVFLACTEPEPAVPLMVCLAYIPRATILSDLTGLHHHHRHHQATISSTISSGQNSNGQPPRKLLNPRGERTNKGVRAFASFNMEPKSDASGGPEFTERLYRLLFALASRRRRPDP